MIFDSNKIILMLKEIIKLGEKLKNISIEKKFTTELKFDNSRVTSADFYSDEQIKLIIKNVFGTYLILSEEDSLDNQHKIADYGEYFIIDPIDGTEAFIAGEEFCINIAYCKNNIPIFGLIAVPWQNIIYYTFNNNVYSFDGKVSCKLESKINKNSIAIGKRSHDKKKFAQIISHLPQIDNIFTKNAGIKYLSTIIGLSGATINFGAIKDWDIAMIFVMANIFNYYLFDGKGQPLEFGKNNFSHDNGIYLIQQKEIANIILKML